MSASIGRRIAAARHEAGMTQAELAAAVGRSRNTIPNWEGGQNVPPHSVMERLCELLGKSISFFYGEPDVDVHDALRRVQELMEHQSITEVQREGSTRELAITQIPEVAAGHTTRGVIAVPESLLPTDVPYERLVACYADEYAPGLAKGDLIIADTDARGIAEGTVVVAEVEGEIVVREHYAVGDMRLLIGEGVTARVEPDAILGRVVRSIHVRNYEAHQYTTETPRPGFLSEAGRCRVKQPVVCYQPQCAPP